MPLMLDTMREEFACFMLDWIRADIAIAKAAPVWNMGYIESLRREEARWEKEAS